MRVAVRGKNVQIRLNNELLVDYVEPTPPVIPAGEERLRFLDHGTFALQCHNEGSKASYRKVRVRPLPDNLPAYTGASPVVDNVYREIINIGRHNVPMVDYHVYLAGRLVFYAFHAANGTWTQAISQKTAQQFDYVVADSRTWTNSKQRLMWLGAAQEASLFSYEE